MTFDVNKIRKDFPALEQKVYGKELVYFDNAATTLKPSVVIERLSNFYKKENSNVHRGVHFLSQEATTAMENARQYIKEFIGASSTSEIIFTKGTTESINLVASSFGKKFIEKGDEIIVSELEHHANIIPWQLLCEEKEAILKVIPVDDAGELDMEAYKNLITSRTKIVAVAHISNALGTINPIVKIIEIAHHRNVPVLIDGAQGISHKSVNVSILDCDFYAFSGHKIFAPMGIGVLYGKEKLLNEMPPYQSGGEMIKEVSFEKTTFNELPFKFEAGTPNVGGILALESALKYIKNIGIDVIESYEHELLTYATAQLKNMPEINIIGNASNKSSLISFVIKGVHHYDAGTILDKLGIAVRTGHHCAQPIMTRFGIDGTLRISFAFYNTKEEINIFVDALKTVIKMFL
ncbi:MAG: cysteine sulfinate desulfinase [Bacteroidetes bacterium CG2_30_33_31]|nr:MAG: cysteine sulfinate desulfinase [Bacteroidetes bacterium CG2_30_33_31]